MLDPHAVHEIFKYLFINILRRRHMPEYVRVDALNRCTQCTSRHLCDFCDVRIEQRLLDSTRHHFFFLSFAVDFSAVECLEILSSNENSALASDFVRVAMDAIVQRSAEIARFRIKKNFQSKRMATSVDVADGMCCVILIEGDASEHQSQ